MFKRMVVLLIVAGLLEGMFHVASGAEFRAVFPANRISLSPDGRSIVGGVGTAAPSAFEAYHLRLDDWKLTILTNSIPGNDIVNAPWSGAFAASADGSVIVGNSHLDNDCFLGNCSVPELTGFSWKAGTTTTLPWLSGDDEAWPLDVTADGSMAVGYSFEDAAAIAGAPNFYRDAVTWDTATGAITELGKYGDDADSWAVAVSEDGSVIVGQSGLIRWDSDETWWRPVFWRPSYGWFQLERIYYGYYNKDQRIYGNRVHGLSNDGKLAAGNLFNGSHILPVSWDLNPTSPGFTKSTLLPLLPGIIHVSGRAYASSKYIQGRGYVIGGYSGGSSFNSAVKKAVLWETDNPLFPVDVRALLLGLGLENAIAGWQLTEVTSISDDAKVIAGSGIHPNGQKWNWYADLRNPQPNETRNNAQYIGQSVGNLFTHRAKAGGSTVDASPSITPIVNEWAKLRPTVWYSYKAAQDGYLSLDLAGSISFSLLTVYRGNETTPMQWTYTCSDPDSVGPCFVPDELKIDANTMYYISVSGMEVPQGEEGFDLYHQFTPITDQCTDAFYLEQTLPASIPGSTNDAAMASAPTCNSVDVTSPGVWFKVVGTGGYMTASLDGAVDYDSKLSVYCSGCATAPTCIKANDDISGQNNQASRVGWCSLPGAVYHVLVHGYGANTGNFKLTVDQDSSFVCLPGTAVSCSVANTDCSAPVPFEETGTMLVDNTNAGTNTSTTSCGTVNNDIWFSYTAKCDGEVVIDTCQSEGSLANTVLALYDGCGGNELACNDNSTEPGCNGLRSAIFLLAKPGQELKILAADVGSAPETGTFPLRIQEIPAAVDIQEKILATVTRGDAVNIQLPISGGCPKPYTGYLASIASGYLPPGLSLNWTGLISGTATTSGQYQFVITVSDGDTSPTHGDSASYEMTVKPANDTCQQAEAITEGMTVFGNFGATTSTIISPVCTGTTSSNTYSSDIWYNYTSSCSGIATVNTCGSEFDTTLAIYDGSTCSATANSLGCNTDDPSACGTGSNGSAMTFNVQNGDKYLIRAGSNDSTGGVQGNGKLLLTCFNDCNDNKVNDLVDIAGGTSKDANSNGLPDECEPTAFPWIMFLPAILGNGS